MPEPGQPNGGLVFDLTPDVIARLATQAAKEGKTIDQKASEALAEVLPPIRSTRPEPSTRYNTGLNFEPKEQDS